MEKDDKKYTLRMMKAIQRLLDIISNLFKPKHYRAMTKEEEAKRKADIQAKWDERKRKRQAKCEAKANAREKARVTKAMGKLTVMTSSNIMPSSPVEAQRRQHPNVIQPLKL